MTNTKRTLVAGFDAFGALRVNPSATLARHLAAKFEDDTVLKVLPTSYSGASKELLETLTIVSPDSVLLLGYSANAHPLKLERLARNADRSSQADNDGATGSSEIVPGATQALAAIADLEQIHTALEQLEIPHTLSDDAGGFVCNHVYYVALHFLATTRPKTPCLFVHVEAPKTREAHAVLERGIGAVFDALRGTGR